MKTIKEAVTYYLPKKKSGELSLTEIRKELHEKSEFSEQDINIICADISDQELTELEGRKPFSLDFLDNNYFSIFMLLASTAIFVFSFRRFDYLMEMSQQAEIEDVQFFVPGIFMLASLIYLVRHIVKIIRRLRK